MREWPPCSLRRTRICIHVRQMHASTWMHTRTVDVVACLRLVLSRFWVMRASDDRADVLPPIFTSQARPAPAGQSLPAMCDPFMSRRLSRSSAISIIWLLRPTLLGQNCDTGQRACCHAAMEDRIGEDNNHISVLTHHISFLTHYGG